MRRLIPPVLHSPELPLAVLSAGRLDGTLWRVHDGYCPVDEPDRPELRALAIRPSIDVRDVLVGRAAAWIHGALSVLPQPLDVCSVTRRSSRWSTGIRYRQLSIAEGEIMSFTDERVLVTTPERTIRDIAGASDVDETDAGIVANLCGNDVRRLQGVIDDIAALPHLPGKAATIEFLSRVAEGLRDQPPLTR